MIDALAEKHSPLKLTDLGESFLIDSLGKKTIDDNTEFFIGEMFKHDLKTNYDVEDKALEVLLKNTGHDSFHDIRITASS